MLSEETSVFSVHLRCTSVDVFTVTILEIDQWRMQNFSLLSMLCSAASTRICGLTGCRAFVTLLSISRATCQVAPGRLVNAHCISMRPSASCRTPFKHSNWVQLPAPQFDPASEHIGFICTISNTCGPRGASRSHDDCDRPYVRHTKQHCDNHSNLQVYRLFLPRRPLPACR